MTENTTLWHRVNLLDDFEDEEDQLSCNNCGPWCPDWGGDGLCMIAIEQQANEGEEYHHKYVIQATPCPTCNEKLTLYTIPVTKLWTWPGDFYNPIIALNIYGAYDIPKGELHRFLTEGKTTVHIWTGTGKARSECLIRLIGEEPET